MRKIVFLATLMILCFCINSFASGNPWEDFEGRHGGYRKEDGNIATNEWCQLWNGSWGYIGEDGYYLENTWFQDVDGKWYYFNEYCYMLTDAIAPDGCYVGTDGAWIKDIDATETSGNAGSAYESDSTIVYWTPSGEKYHVTDKCSTLARSKTILSGTIVEAGARDDCEVCC